jgi:hypothetical protein
MADEFRAIDTRSEILRIIDQVVYAPANDDAGLHDATDSKSARRHLTATRFAQPLASSRMPSH